MCWRAANQTASSYCLPRGPASLYRPPPPARPRMIAVMILRYVFICTGIRTVLVLYEYRGIIVSLYVSDLLNVTISSTSTSTIL